MNIIEKKVFLDYEFLIPGLVKGEFTVIINILKKTFNTLIRNSQKNILP
jgi:hypothetical protein